MQTRTTAIATGAATSGKLETVLGVAMAAVLGLVLLWGVGFSHIEIAHNVAHDVRHSNAFPCH